MKRRILAYFSAAILIFSLCLLVSCDGLRKSIVGVIEKKIDEGGSDVKNITDESDSVSNEANADTEAYPLQSAEELSAAIGGENLSEMKNTLSDFYSSMPKFQALNISDSSENISDDIFSGYDLTMINFWGTFCGPCIEEMPDLAELGKSLDRLSENYGKVQILGIVTDGVGNENDAKTIMDNAGVSFQNIYFERGSQSESDVLSPIMYVPSTIFVDSSGKLVGGVKIGGGTREEYEELIKYFLLTK